MKSLKSFFLTLALLVPLLAPAAAQADDCKPDVMTRLKRMHKSAMEDLDQMEFASAKKTLEDAISMARRELCDETLEYANILVNLGIMYVTDPDSPDESRGRLRFKSAVNVNPCAKVNPDLANPKLIKMLDEERTKAGVVCKGGDPGSKDPGPKDPGPKDPGPKDPGPVDEEDTGPEPQRIEHEVPDEAPALTTLTLKCRAPQAGGVKKVVIYYRKDGETNYTAAEMQNFSGYSWKVSIPRDHVKGTVFQYYIAALSDNNKPVMANGNSGAPNIISLTKPTGTGPAEEECDPLNPASCKKKDGSKPDPGPKTPGDIKWHLNLGGRWGAGYLSTSMCSFMAVPSDPSICDGKGVNIHTPGFAFGELGGELGLHYFVTDSVSLGLDAKAGFVTTDYADEGSPYGVGFSGLGKVRWFPTGRKELFRPYLGGVLGGGLMWHSWQVDENLGKTDIFQHGFVMAGATFGFQVGSPSVAFYINLDAIGIFPQQSTFHLDVSAGIVMSF